MDFWGPTRVLGEYLRHLMWTPVPSVTSVRLLLHLSFEPGAREGGFSHDGAPRDSQMSRELTRPLGGTGRAPDSTMLVSACGDYVVRVWDSVPRVERYAQVLANCALEEEVREDVTAIHKAQATPEAALAEVRRRWSDDASRRRAAIKVLARLQL